MRFILLASTILCVWAQTETPRYLNFEVGVSIKNRLKSADRYVVIERNGPLLLGDVPRNAPPQEVLEAYTLHAAAVLLVRLTSRKYVLTPRADWIVTRFQGVIEDQLKPSPFTLQIEDFVLQTDGGIVNIGRARVEASVFWEPEFHLDRKYLTFPTERRWPANSSRTYELGSDGKLKNIEPNFNPDSDTDTLHGFSFATAKQIILAAPARGRPPRNDPAISRAQSYADPLATTPAGRSPDI